MYKKISKLLAVVTIIFTTTFTTVVNANEYSINDLIENGKKLDKTNISITGEAIGEPLKRGKYSWININDTTNSMGIYMTAEDEKKVDMYGGYKQKGDTIQVNGIFNRACKEHGGDMDIHATEVSVVEDGNIVNYNIPSYKITILSISTIIVVVIAAVFYFKNKNNNQATL